MSSTPNIFDKLSASPLRSWAHKFFFELEHKPDILKAIEKTFNHSIDITARSQLIDRSIIFVKFFEAPSRIRPDMQQHVRIADLIYKLFVCSIYPPEPNISVSDHLNKLMPIRKITPDHVTACQPKILVETNGTDLDQQSTSGLTPGMLACHEGYWQKQEELVKASSLTLRDDLGNDALHYAFFSGKEPPLEMIERFLNQGGSIYQENKMGESILFRALRNGCKNAVQCFIKHNLIDFNKTFREGLTILHAAVASNNAELVEFLLKQPLININALANSGWSALEFALYLHQDHITKILLSKDASLDCVQNKSLLLFYLARTCDNIKILTNITDKYKIQIDSVDKQGRSALHHAVMGKNVKIIPWLLQQGLKFDQLSSTKQTPLGLAIENQDYHIVKLILDTIKIQNQHNPEFSLAVSVSEPLKIAARIYNDLLATPTPGLGRMMNRYQTAGENLSSKNQNLLKAKSIFHLLMDTVAKDKKGPSPFYFFIENHLHRLLKRHLKDHPGLVTQVDKDTEGGLLMSVLRPGKADDESLYDLISCSLSLDANCVETIKILLDHGADPFKTNDNGYCTVDLALAHRNLKLINTLLDENTAPKIAQRIKGEYFVHLFTFSKSSTADDYNAFNNFMKKMIDNGMDLNLKDRYKNTLLHFAAHIGSSELIKILLEKGANPIARNTRNRTPLSWLNEEWIDDMYEYGRPDPFSCEAYESEQPKALDLINQAMDKLFEDQQTLRNTKRKRSQDEVERSEDSKRHHG